MPAMKFVAATIAREDLSPLLIALVREGFHATVFDPATPLDATATLMIGVQAVAVPGVFAVFRRICRAGSVRYVVLNIVRFERVVGG